MKVTPVDPPKLWLMPNITPGSAWAGHTVEPHNVAAMVANTVLFKAISRKGWGYKCWHPRNPSRTAIPQNMGDLPPRG